MFAWIETSVAGTPDFIRTLANVVYDFELAKCVGVPSTKITPGRYVISYLVNEALKFKDVDGEEPDGSPAISLRKDGQLEYVDAKAEELLERIKEGWDVTIRVLVGGSYRFVNVNREGVLVTFL
ncbi:hypothetical protein DRP05_15275 [Archaeoglobales archaeon]|nr:MAG: hypothetical protein DRP05_15275 [Archaeoglobales archaeon]